MNEYNAPLSPSHRIDPALLDRARLEMSLPPSRNSSGGGDSTWTTRSRTRLPEFFDAGPDVSTSVTIRDCSTHSCGWEAGFFENAGCDDDALAAMVTLMDKLVRMTPRTGASPRASAYCGFLARQTQRDSLARVDGRAELRSEAVRRN